jgi:hypothetical protein
LISQLFHIGPPEGSGLACLQSPSALTDAFESRPRLILIYSANVRDEPRHRFPMPGNDYLFAALDAVEEGTQSVFGIEGTDLVHGVSFSIKLA